MTEAREIFALIDQLDAHAVAALFAEDAVMVFGNNDQLLGRAAILAGNTAMLAHIKGLRHVVRQEWTVDDTTIAVTDVTYTRRDDKQVTVPAVSIWRVDGDGLIAEYRVYYDLAPLFAA